MHFADPNNLRDLNGGVAHTSGHVTAGIPARASLSGVSPLSIWQRVEILRAEKT